MLRKILIVGSFSTGLVGCQSVGGGCPPMVKYSAVQQQQAAKELRAQPKDSQIAKMIVDYKKTRDACRIR